MNEVADILAQILCPPGNGVYTVHTAGQHRQALHQILFNNQDGEKIAQAWRHQLNQWLHKPHSPCLLGVSSDNGGGIQRGANWGPLFIRLKWHELFGMQNTQRLFDVGDVRVIPHLLYDNMLSAAQLMQSRSALYQQAQSSLPVSPLSIAELACTLLYEHNPDCKILALGGDHSVSFPLVKSFLQHQKKRCAIIHFDAHTDLLPSRLGVEICFGSWARHILPMLKKPSDLIQIGIRSSGKDKQYWQNELGVTQYWAQEWHQNPEIPMDAILEYLQREKIDSVYVSFDIDALDERYASATGTPEPGGLAPDQVAMIMEQLRPHCRLLGADLVEVAPMVNWDNAPAKGRETTLLNAALIMGKLLDWMNQH
jgi:agmatinase